MRITDLEKTMGSFRLKVDHLFIEPGKIHGLVGQNGSGKTILLKTIMGIIKPDRGSIDYEGLELTDITMLSQRPYMLHASVYENLIYPLKIRGIRPDASADRLLERTGLLGQKDQYAGSLSSGERQKLSFARAIIFGPKFVMMDETLSNLDPRSEEILTEMIREIQEKLPITWIIVTHQMEQKRRLCDVVHRMGKGRYCGIMES